jgi:hypothetical protein
MNGELAGRDSEDRAVTELTAGGGCSLTHELTVLTHPNAHLIRLPLAAAAPF